MPNMVSATGSPSPRHPRRGCPRCQPHYLDPASVDIAAYEADPDTFVVPHAGEVLYRLRLGQRPGALGEPDGRGPSTAGWDG
jgi:hypothetical protein